MDEIEEFEELLQCEQNPENIHVLENELDDRYESYLDMKDYLYEKLMEWYSIAQTDGSAIRLSFFKVLKALRDGKVQQ